MGKIKRNKGLKNKNHIYGPADMHACSSMLKLLRIKLIRSSIKVLLMELISNFLWCKSGPGKNGRDSTRILSGHQHQDRSSRPEFVRSLILQFTRSTTTYVIPPRPWGKPHYCNFLHNGETSITSLRRDGEHPTVDEVFFLLDTVQLWS